MSLWAQKNTNPSQLVSPGVFLLLLLLPVFPLRAPVPSCKGTPYPSAAVWMPPDPMTIRTAFNIHVQQGQLYRSNTPPALLLTQRLGPDTTTGLQYPCCRPYDPPLCMQGRALSKSTNKPIGTHATSMCQREALRQTLYRTSGNSEHVGRSQVATNHRAIPSYQLRTRSISRFTQRQTRMTAGNKSRNHSSDLDCSDCSATLRQLDCHCLSRVLNCHVFQFRYR